MIYAIYSKRQQGAALEKPTFHQLTWQRKNHDDRSRWN